MADKNEQDPVAEENRDAQTEAASVLDAEVAAKDMMHEGAPPPSQAGAPVDPDELDGSITIEVTEGDGSESDEGEPSEPGAEVDPLEELRLKVAEAEAKADEYLDKMQRTAAEFQNSRRRQEKQMADEIERANGQLIKRLLPILDDFGLAFQNVPAGLSAEEGDSARSDDRVEQAWVNGFRQIHKKLSDTLTEQGLEMIPTQGEFDPTLHEAISSEPSDAVESGHIIETLRAGYIYKGQVIRPALIRVAA